MTDSSVVTDRGFPGGRAKLPLLGNAPGTTRPNRTVTFVGTAFVRPPDARSDEPAPAAPGGFEGYFTYESLFESGPPTIEAGPPVDVEAHEILGVPVGADWDEVVAAHRRLAKAHHPDRHQGEPRPLREANTERFHRISDAFSRLEAVYRAGGLTAPTSAAG